MQTIIEAEEALFQAASELGTLNVLALVVVVIALVAVCVLGLLVWKIMAPLLRQNMDVFNRNAESMANLNLTLKSYDQTYQTTNRIQEQMTLTIAATASSLNARIGESEDVFEAGLTTLTQRITGEREIGVKKIIDAQDRRFDVIERGISTVSASVERLQQHIDKLPKETSIDGIRLGLDGVRTQLQILVNLNQQMEKRYDQVESIHGNGGSADGAALRATSDGAGGSTNTSS